MAFQNPSTRVLIHCNLGISRSSTLLLAYLMKKYNATLYEAYKFLRHRRPIVCPNLGFLRQLLDYEHDLFSYVYTDINDQIFHWKKETYWLYPNTKDICECNKSYILCSLILPFVIKACSWLPVYFVHNCIDSFLNIIQRRLLTNYFSLKHVYIYQ